MNLTRRIQGLFRYFGIHISNVPLKYYYELENEIKNNLLNNSSGVLHVGAHFGQERDVYHSYGLDVIWVEAIPEVFEILQTNIRDFREQKAICALVGNKDVQEISFYLSNNLRSASSVYKLSDKSRFRNVYQEGVIKLPMVTLEGLFPKNSLENFDHWVVDVQGSELSVLQGAGTKINFCKSIQVEVSTRETYINGSKYIEIKSFLQEKGFFPLWEPKNDDHTDVIFIRSNL